MRPCRAEGKGRPLSAFPSDKTGGGRRMRPIRDEAGGGRPKTSGTMRRRTSPIALSQEIHPANPNNYYNSDEEDDDASTKSDDTVVEDFAQQCPESDLFTIIRS